MKDYLSNLKKAIKAAQGFDSEHEGTYHVKSMFRDTLVWEGDVELFNLIGHPTVSQCYAWGTANGDQFDAVTILAVPQIDSPLKAVMIWVAGEAKRRVRIPECQNPPGESL